MKRLGRSAGGMLRQTRTAPLPRPTAPATRGRCPAPLGSQKNHLVRSAGLQGDVNILCNVIQLQPLEAPHPAAAAASPAVGYCSWGESVTKDPSRGGGTAAVWELNSEPNNGTEGLWHEVEQWGS